VRQRTVVVIGHGMVGHRFVEALRARDTDGAWRIVVFGEEADAAYDRVGLSSYVGAWDRSLLALTGNDYRGDHLVELRLGNAVTAIDRDAKRLNVADGSKLDYDALVLATGSYPFVPPVPGTDSAGCHVYYIGRSGCDPDRRRGGAGLRPRGRRHCRRWRAARPGGR
jgi:nitrite reductase (NADH) large subunit